jgi:hypothetical protein
LILGQLLNREFLDATLAPLAESLAALRSGEVDHPVDAPGGLTEHDLWHAEAELRELVGRLPLDPPEQGEASASRRGVVPPVEDLVYIPRDATASIVQSALEQAYREREPPGSERRAVTVPLAGTELPAVTDEFVGGEPPVPSQTTGGQRRLFGRFEVPSDVRWASCLIAEGLRHFRDRKPFVDAPVHRRIGNRVRLVVVGDWGTGIPRARRVGESMRDVLLEGVDQSLEQHAVHLGDVYYSGFRYEYRDRFLANWPVWPDEAQLVSSWSLAGNHDLYSGGYGYFETLLADPRFAGHCGCSYFLLENEHWRIVGLDTAWEDGGLAGEQAAWLGQLLAGERKRTLLLSHHQGVSVYGEAPAKLHEKITPVLRGHPCDLWLWGHEHRCMAFESSELIGAGRCLGHGGVPEYQFHGANDPVPSPGSWEYRDVVPTTLGLEPWGVFGFAVVELEAATATIRYLNEFGNEHHPPDSL